METLGTLFAKWPQKYLKATGSSVKMEGGSEIIESIERILTAGIPVMGHLGLTPQSIYKFGTYTVRAKEEAEAEKLLVDAKLLEEAGCFGLVLEKVPSELAKKVAESISIPVIGIGGIATAEDIIEFILAGASLVQIGTMNYQNPNLGPELKDELSNYLKKEGIKDLDNLIGKVEYHSN